MKRIISVVLVFLLFGCATKYVKTTVDPSCTEEGYTICEDSKTGNKIIKDETEPLGHDFDEWTILDEDQHIKSRRCKRCGFVEKSKGIQEKQIPVVRLDGDINGMSKKDRVTLKFSLEGFDDSFECLASTTWQGHSTLELEKKNYTVRLFDDNELTEKHRVQFEDWHPEHKYILKANYYDYTSCRNLMCADVWSKIVECRENLNPQLRNLINYGAVDGFPVALYINDGFVGLYNFNVHKDDDLYDMKDGYNHAIIIANSQNKDESLFKERTSFSDDSDWELEYCGTENDSWAIEKFNDFINFVMNSSNEEFIDNLHDYVDVEALIDYLIFMYSMGLTTSYAKDLTFITYGDELIPTVYDMENAFGLFDDGEGSYMAKFFLPYCSNGVWSSCTNSLLWDRLLNSFEKEIKDRYKQLRCEVLSEQSLIQEIEEHVYSIPAKYYEMDKETYQNRKSVNIDINQITQYIIERMPLLDEILG